MSGRSPRQSPVRMPGVQRRMDSLLGEDREATDSVAGHYNPAMQKTASEHVTRQVSWQMGCSSNRVPLLSASGRKLRPQFTQAHVKREDFEKNTIWWDESQLLS